MILRRGFLFLFSAAMLVLGAAGAVGQPASQAASFDLLIRNGRLVDGSGNPWCYADVGIRQGKIAALGALADATAPREIDAKGLVVAPGFIDLHTHADAGLFNIPDAGNFTRDGVTTLVTGNCGGSVNDIGAYLARLQEEGVALNVATLVGHNTILRWAKGNVATPLTPQQLRQCKARLRQAMREGAFGMSTGLEYTPGRFSSTEEIIELQKAVAELGGLYASHMRNEDITIIPAVEEALRIGREAGCRVEISHFKIARNSLDDGIRIPLQMVLDARREGLEVWLDQYPYTASSTGITLLLPERVFEGGSESAKAILSDPEQAAQVIAEMVAYHRDKRHRPDFSFAVISSCRAYPEYVGMNVTEIARRMKLKQAQPGASEAAPSEALPEVTMEEECRAIIDIYLQGGASCVYHTMDEEDVIRIMQCPLTSVCSDSGVRRPGRSKPHPRGYGSRARVLGRYVREMNVLTLEEAVRKMTSLPAQAFRFKERGLLREGYWADITIFDPETVSDRATYEDPHQYSEGVEYVLVNGEMIVAQGQITGKLPGKPLYGPAYRPEELEQAKGARATEEHFIHPRPVELRITYHLKGIRPADSDQVTLYEFSEEPVSWKVERKAERPALLLYVARQREWPNQRNVEYLSIEPPPDQIVSKDIDGNVIEFWDLSARIGREEEITITRHFRFDAYETACKIDPSRVQPYDPEDPVYRYYTRTQELIELTPEVKALAQSIIGSETNPYYQAKAIYGWCVDHIDYVYPPNRGLRFCLSRRTGDCGSYSLIFVALCRAVGIPARVVNGHWCCRAKNNYHVWNEFYLPPYGWIPADATDGRITRDEPGKLAGEGDAYYYFGNLDSGRFVSSKGTSIQLYPSPPWHEWGLADANRNPIFFQTAATVFSGITIDEQRATVEIVQGKDVLW